MENKSCDKVLEEDEWTVLQQRYKVNGHDGKSAPKYLTKSYRVFR